MVPFLGHPECSFTGNFKVKTVIVIVIDYFDW